MRDNLTMRQLAQEVAQGRYRVDADRVAQALLARGLPLWRTVKAKRPVDERALAVEQERERIADRLHDEVLGTLLAAHQDLREQPADTTAALFSLDTAIAALRQVVADEHPVTQPGRRLTDALHDVLDPICHRADLTLTVDVRGQPQQVGAMSALLLSAVRELAANTARHAKATRLTVTVRPGPGSVICDVHDDGQGIDLAQTAARRARGHLGLARLEHHLRAAGGGMVLTSRPGSTTVTIAVPV